MPRSQNGFSANDRSVIRSALIPGTDVKVAVRKGPAGDLLVAAAARWHRDVEPLRAADGVLDAWGYAERTIRGSSTTLSNHASGTALDLRARRHPLGTAPLQNFTPEQVEAVRRIVRDFSPALRWGGDYSGRKDGMHIEVVTSEDGCATVLARRGGGAPAAPAPAAPGKWPTVRQGSTGHAVGVIQRFLGLVDDGKFGPKTTAAVIRYQQAHGLAADGVVGDRTWAATGL